MVTAGDEDSFVARRVSSLVEGALRSYVVRVVERT
jgi:hypothetical protein